jgi:hypothetical protein
MYNIKMGFKNQIKPILYFSIQMYTSIYQKELEKNSFTLLLQFISEMLACFIVDRSRSRKKNFIRSRAASSCIYSGVHAQAEAAK